MRSKILNNRGRIKLPGHKVILPDGGFSVGRGVAHKGLARSLEYIATNYRKTVMLKDVVAVSGMSRRGLIKAFNRHVGKPPGSLIRQMRIEYSKRLLLTKDLPLKCIARQTGFRSENTFCVAFQRATGMAPKKYQRSALLATCRLAFPHQLLVCQDISDFTPALNPCIA